MTFDIYRGILENESYVKCEKKIKNGENISKLFQESKLIFKITKAGGIDTRETSIIKLSFFTNASATIEICFRKRLSFYQPLHITKKFVTKVKPGNVECIFDILYLDDILEDILIKVYPENKTQLLNLKAEA